MGVLVFNYSLTSFFLFKYLIKNITATNKTATTTQAIIPVNTKPNSATKPATIYAINEIVATIHA